MKKSAITKKANAVKVKKVDQKMKTEKVKQLREDILACIPVTMCRTCQPADKQLSHTERVAELEKVLRCQQQ